MRRIYIPRELPVAEKLALWSIPEPNSGCLLWLGGYTRHGYGTLKHKGRFRQVHQWAWELAHGPIPAGKAICHRCDVRGCINVDHLWLGTNAENTADRVLKGRSAHGERSGVSTISVETAKAIRDAEGGYKRIAKQFSVSRSIVRRIRLGKHWAQAIAEYEQGHLIPTGRIVASQRASNHAHKNPEYEAA